MSYFDDASLVLIPSGYKDQKVYSVKPLDGSGDLTFSRASSATRVASNGLIEKVRTNLFLYSEQFNNTAAWQYQGGATINANAGIAPNGTTTADLLYPSINGSIVAAIQAITSASSVEYTQSVYVKASGKNFVGLYTFDGTAGTTMWVNLTTGAITNGIGSSVSGRFATNVGSGWWRIGFTDIGNGTTTYMHVYPTDAASSNSVTANGTDGILLWGAQLETGVATDYIATTSAAVSVGPVSGLPRLDYLGSTCPRLLLEPQRTNVVTYSEQINNAAWIKTSGGTGSNPAVTANNAISPDGYQNADTIVFNSGAGTTTSDQSYLYQGFTTGAGSHTASFYAKTASGTAQLLIRLDSTNYQKITITNQWQRFTLTQTLVAGTNYLDLVIRRGINEPLNSSATIQIWGVQVEAGAYATSYIPTLGTSVTRVVDAASKTSASALIGQTEGTVFWEFQLETTVATGHEDILNIDNGNFGNTIYLVKTAAGAVGAEIYNAGVMQASIFLAGAPAGRYKCALGYANNNSAVFVNGVQVGTTDTSCTIPATNRIQLGNGVLGASTGKTIQVLLFKTRLSNSDLAALTA
jgi:hypothetical protein